VAFTHRNLAILMLAAGACSVRSPVVVSPAPSTPEATVAEFLAAVNAADLGRMAELWGTEQGPSTITNPNPPQVRQRQLTIMQRVLRNDEHRVLGMDPERSGPEGRVYNVELSRSGRRVSVPFTMVQARTGGWLIHAIDLQAAFPSAETARPSN
jgi:hypothetical protein